jgi:hypothetical protein
VIPLRGKDDWREVERYLLTQPRPNALTVWKKPVVR